MFPFSYDIPAFWPLPHSAPETSFHSSGVGSGVFCNESTVVYIPLIWDTALSEILDEGDTESEGNQEAGSSEEDEDDDDEEEDEDGKHMTGILQAID